MYQVIQIMKKLEDVIKKFDMEEKLTNKMLTQEKLENMILMNNSQYDYSISSNIINELTQDIRSLLGYLRTADSLIRNFKKFDQDTMASREDPLYLEYLNLKRRNEVFKDENLELTNRVRDLNSQVDQSSQYRDLYESAKASLKEKSSLIDSLRAEGQNLQTEIDALKNSQRHWEEGMKVLHRDNRLVKESIDKFSVPMGVNLESRRDVFTNKFLLVFFPNKENSDKNWFTPNKVLRTLTQFLLPEDMQTLAYSCKTMKQ
jgi:hypothetical protein